MHTGPRFLYLLLPLPRKSQSSMRWLRESRQLLRCGGTLAVPSSATARRRWPKRLWGDNSLVVAHLRVNEAISLRGTASASTSSSEQEVLHRRAWAFLVPVHALLLRRLADNTLLLGTIKQQEVTYCVRVQAFARKAKGKPVSQEADAVLQGVGGALGYVTLLDAVYDTLALLIELRGSGLPRESAHGEGEDGGGQR